MSALAMELIELGPSMSQARNEEAYASKSTHRRSATSKLLEGVSQEPLTDTKATCSAWALICALLGATVCIYSIFATPFGGRAFSYIIGILAACTMATTIICAFYGQLQLRRGVPIDSLFLFLACTIWTAAFLLTGLSSTNTQIQLATVFATVASATVPLVLLSRRVASTYWLRRVSIRLAIAAILLRDAEVYEQKPESPKTRRTSRLSSWYKATTGTSEKANSGD